MSSGNCDQMMTSDKQRDKLKPQKKSPLCKTLTLDKSVYEEESRRRKPRIPQDNYEKITLKLSKEMQNFLPSPQMMRKRRNATCEEIEKRTSTDEVGGTLRKDRSDMLQYNALKEMFFA